MGTTSGEWRAGRSDMVSYTADCERAFKNIYVDDPNGRRHHVTGERLPKVVGKAYDTLDGDCVSNANVMAASKDLLEACELLLASRPQSGERNVAIAKAEIAVRKARGES